VNGFEDEQLRALLRVPVSASLDGERMSLSDGEYPLLGTMLPDGHRLDINYAAKTVELT
jgi:hypothetical protein